MLQVSSTVSNQIRFLLQSFNDTNIDYVSGELCKFIDHGIEGSILVLQTCLEHLNCHRADSKNMQLGPLFASTFKYILDKPSFNRVFCQSLKSTTINKGFLQSLSNALDLSAVERIGIGLNLSESENLDIRMSGKNFSMAQIEELCANPISIDSAEKIQNIIMFLHRSGGLSKHVGSFRHMLSLVPLTEGFILDPLLSDELCEGNFTRSLDSFYEGSENDFDTILAEMDKNKHK